MSEWSTTRLDDLCHKITVGHVGKMSDQYVDRGVPFLRSQDIKPGFIERENVKYVSQAFHERLSKSSLSPGDVVMVRTGYPGTAAVVPDTLPIANCADLVIAKPGPSLDPRYLAYLMNSSWGKGMVGGRLVGAAQQHFNVRVAQALEIPTPPLVLQQRIAAILGAYDDLIEVNRRRVAVLEEMARGLFEEWFVRFRYPGHEGVPIVDTPDGPLPEGWENSTVKSLVKRVPVSKRYSQKSASSEGRVPILDQGKQGVIGYHDEKPTVDASEETPVIVFANHTCYQKVVHFSFSAIQNVLPFLPSKDAPNSPYWLHHATADLVFLNDYKGHWPELMAKVIVVPTPDLAARFDRLVGPIHVLVHKLKSKEQSLAASRDLLLPRLISGQLSVEAAERQLEDAA